jgi:two-component system LytT family response regulator
LSSEELAKTKPKLMNERIVFPSNSCNIVVNTNEIIYCEAQGNYSKVVCINNNEFLVTKYLKDIEALLGDKNFVRIHRKYLVNINFICEYAFNRKPFLKLDGSIKLPVSNRRISNVRKAIENN